jgi:hypothetical protein
MGCIPLVWVICWPAKPPASVITTRSRSVPKTALLRITIPTAVAPRYGNPANSLQPHQVPESDVVAEYPFSLSVHIGGDGETSHDDHRPAPPMPLH